jgi:NTE family protein
MSEITDSVKGSVKKATDIIKQVLGVPRKVGLVLGGGGARGMAHIGVLKVLTDNKIPIDLIAGTSSGALMGALFSGGVSPYDMAKIARAADWIKLVKFRFSKAGPVSGEGIEKLITDNMQSSVIEGLRIPLAIIATDIKTGEKVIIKEGDLARAVHASSAIPGVFLPVMFQGRLLCDGLIVDNVPVEVVKQMGADFIIAVDVVPNVVIGDWQPNVISLIERALDIVCRKASGPQKLLADIVIDPVYKNYSALSIKDADILIKMGEEAALKMIPEIKDKLKIT